jgi:hypothetical protein
MMDSLTVVLMGHSSNKGMWSYLNNKVVNASYLTKDIE